MGLDGAVGGGVGDAGEDEAAAHLVVVKERLVGLVDGTSLLRWRRKREGMKERERVGTSAEEKGERLFPVGKNSAFLFFRNGLLVSLSAEND